MPWIKGRLQAILRLEELAGASDCAACVGVMLDVARAVITNTAVDLKSPLLFLFNGGEESHLLAAHGFMQHSKWAFKLGAFINLESTGPAGPAYLFQHTGDTQLLVPCSKANASPHLFVATRYAFENNEVAWIRHACCNTWTCLRANTSKASSNRLNGQGFPSTISCSLG